MIHLDTCVLIDLARETTRGKPGPALALLESLDDDEILAASIHVVCELRAGAERSRNPLKEHEELDRLLEGLLVAYPDHRFAPVYARVLATLASRSAPVATMDVLIATAALLDDAPLVTRNRKDFSRIPGLRIMSY